MTARGSYKVSVTKDYLVFASAHFITFAGEKCEPLHGHNYRASATLEGALDEESWYVVDFSVLKQLMRRLCDEIDHKVLLPRENPRLVIETRPTGVRGDDGKEERALHVALDGRPKYVFPESDCVLLPIPNTTVEMLARHLAGRVRDEMRAAGAAGLTAVQVEVEENFGQGAVYREELRAN